MKPSYERTGSVFDEGKEEAREDVDALAHKLQCDKLDEIYLVATRTLRTGNTQMSFWGEVTNRFKTIARSIGRPTFAAGQKPGQPISVKDWIGPRQEWKVADVQAAIKMANDFRASGTYTWFRGQKNAAWKVISSGVRREIAAINRQESDESNCHEIILETLGKFMTWAALTPGLEVVSKDHWQSLAILQHYGFPTYLIDFSTAPEVAGYFAVEGALGGDMEFRRVIRSVVP